MKRFIFPILIAVAVAFSAMPTQAADEKAPAERREQRPRAIPFRGKIVAVDKQAKTIKISGERERVFHIGSETRLVKAGKPATLEDATVGEEVAGAYREGADKKLEASMVRFGPRPEGARREPRKEEPKKEPKKEQ